MKSKAFHLFNNLSYSLFFNEVTKSDYYMHLNKRLNIFSSVEKRSLLIKQKIEYILLNFDVNEYEIIIDYKIDKIKITKNKKIYIPYKNNESNFFYIIFNLTEVIMKDFLNKKPEYKSYFASIYLYLLKKVYKIENNLILKFCNELNVKNDLVSIIYDGFIEKEAWEKIRIKNYFKLEDGIYDENEKFISRNLFNNNFLELIICKFPHKKIKVFEIIK